MDHFLSSLGYLEGSSILTLASDMGKNKIR